MIAVGHSRQRWKRIARVVILAGGLAGGLGACVSTPVPDLHVDLPTRWRNATEASPAPAQVGPWWKALSDPRLDALIDQSLASNLDIAQAMFRLRAARALYRTAGAELRPGLHLMTSNPVDPDASASYLMVGFDSVWELGLFGRGKATHRMAKGALQGAEADLADARLSLPAEVARQWLLLQSAQRRASLLSSIRQARAEQSRLVETRYRLRLSSAQEVAQAHAALAQAEMAATEPRASATSAAQALAVLLGQAEPDPDWLKPDLATQPRVSDFPLQVVPADLLRRRPDVARAEAAVLSAVGELGLAKADRYPSIAIAGSLVRSTSEAERLQTDTGSIGSIGPLIDIPLFDWGMRRAKAVAKGDMLQAAVAAYRKDVLTGVAESESALAALGQDREREQSALAAHHAFAQIADVAQRREKLALASGIDVAASNAERDQAALDLVAARTMTALDYIALCKALGGSPDVVAGAASAASNGGP